MMVLAQRLLIAQPACEADTGAGRSPVILAAALFWLERAGITVPQLMADVQCLGFGVALLRMCLGMGTRMASAVQRADSR